MKELGAVIYEGPSLIGDRSDVVGILIWKSANVKTGDMIQLYVLPAKRSPLEALREDDNRGACGDCKLQGAYDPERGKMVGRICYVNVGQAPEGIYRKYITGGYPEFSKRLHRRHLQYRKIRLGAYGDPAALPMGILRYLVRTCSRGHTGYTHQVEDMTRRRADAIASVCMVSTETEAQRLAMQARGYRTFHVQPGAASPPPGDVECLFYTKHLQCRDCLRCKGADQRGPSIFVRGHGRTAANLPQLVNNVHH